MFYNYNKLSCQSKTILIVESSLNKFNFVEVIEFEV